MQAYGSTQLDASLLIMPSTGFLPASDPRVKATIEAIERELLCDGFVMRYDTGNDRRRACRPGEGVFLACSFWLADAYVLLGRVDEARALFERLLALRNDVGLLSEEYDTRPAAAGRQLSAGVLARGADQHGAQPESRHKARAPALAVAWRRGLRPDRCCCCRSCRAASACSLCVRKETGSPGRMWAPGLALMVYPYLVATVAADAARWRAHRRCVLVGASVRLVGRVPPSKEAGAT